MGRFVGLLGKRKRGLVKDHMAGYDLIGDGAKTVVSLVLSGVAKEDTRRSEE